MDTLVGFRTAFCQTHMTVFSRPDHAVNMRYDIPPFAPFGQAVPAVSNRNGSPYKTGGSQRRDPSPAIDVVARRTVNTAPKLAAERDYLRLSRREQADAIATKIAELDQKIEPRSPVASPVQVGTTQKFTDPYMEGRVSFVHRLLGGQEIIVIIPLRADCDDVTNAVETVVDTVLAQLEP